VISGLGRGIVAGSPIEGTEKLDNVIQTDAAINPGNSGGPLFNSGGQVIGVNVAVSQSGQNIGFALPINLIKESINIFRTTGEFERPYLGVGYKMISKEVAAKNKVNSGAYVESVTENSPAYKAKIQKGDIISEIDGQKLTESDNGDLVKIINKKKIGDVVTLKYFRDNKEQVVSVILEKKQN
jgi:serine protease Do